MLEVQGLCKSFGGIRAVREIDFSVSKGQIFSLIGPNGAGKTTCFNLITGFYKPTAGRVIWDGEEVTLLQPYEMASRGVIRTFQKTNVLRNLCVLDNVIHAHYLQEKTPLWRTFWASKQQSLHSREIADSARAIVELVGLGHKMYADANALSCGELRLLEVGVALGAKPRLLMLDEPAAGLNTREADDLAKLLLTLPGLWVESLLLVEHNMHLVMQVSDSIVVMNFGQKLASGTPQEIQSNPAVLEAYMGKAA